MTAFAKATAPIAEKRPKTIKLHGRERVDNYAWLRDDNWQEVMRDPSVLDSDIRAHLEAENAYTEAVLADTKTLQTAIFEEMKGRIKDDDSTVPAPDGEYAYAHRYRPGDQQGVYVRYDIGESRFDWSNEVIVLDADKAADGQPYFDIGGMSQSLDHRYVAWSVDHKGSERYTLFVKDMDSGKSRTLYIDDASGGIVWAADNKTLFWVRRDENQRPCEVLCADVTTDSLTPHSVYTEDDPGMFISIGMSEGRSFIEVSVHDHTRSELWLIPASEPKAAPQCVHARSDKHEYDLSESEENFFILTNTDDATDFQIMQAPKDNPARENWETLIPHRPGRLILGVHTTRTHLVWLERENALPRIVIREIASGDTHAIDFEDEAYALGLIGGEEFDTPWLRFSYSSPVQPGQVFDYDVVTRERRLLKTTEVPSGHSPSDYKCERIMVTARDGEDVPVTLLMQSDFKADGSAPCLLYGYGSYGITIPASFRTSILSLVDRGFVYAIAHIRGGMAKGYGWYLDGKLEQKTKTFDDFVDVGRDLAKRGYTSEGRLIAHGGSAGGLLVGAALNQAPELFGGVIAAVPFVDVLTTMSDDSLPLTPPEWPEWGNPLTDADAYDRLESYSPYDQVNQNAFPPVLITAGLTDPRVTYWEPAKWAAKLREHQTGNAPILLKTNMDAGHGGESGRYARLKEVATEYAFAVTIAGAEK